MRIREFRSLFLLFASCLALGAPVAAQPAALPSTDAPLEEAFRQADADHNGALTRNEAIRAKLSLSDKKTFDGVDSDHNGVVTLFELGDALQARIPRYFPWQFGVDFDVIGRGSPQDIFDAQLDVRELLRGQHETEWVIISTGMFMSYLFEPEFGKARN